jgi:hypothetical protein
MYCNLNLHGHTLTVDQKITEGLLRTSLFLFSTRGAQNDFRILEHVSQLCVKKETFRPSKILVVFFVSLAKLLNPTRRFLPAIDCTAVHLGFHISTQEENGEV